MNYIGSKFSLLDFLRASISAATGYKESDSYVFADLFAGTGVVGAAYKAGGCKVIANDIQYYSYINTILKMFRRLILPFWNI